MWTEKALWRRLELTGGKRATLPPLQPRGLTSTLPAATATMVLRMLHNLQEIYRSRQDAPLLAALQQRITTVTTRVQFAPLSDAEIDAYVASGEPLQCAGGFALEGRGGAVVERIEGCFSNVIGLSLPLLRRWLTDASMH